ncbi:MAG: GDP-mannose 4,6-dehydratase [Anaerolineales bacterium]|nr:GDP-mannose 4,6-dehydratase [Anaerolineales bacterium]
MGRYLVSGAAGFIGARVSELLLQEGHTVVGIDNLNLAYDVRLKEYRLKRLQNLGGFEFHKEDISDRAAMEALEPAVGDLDGIINMAARAGVRSSVENPWIYLNTNVTGTLNLLELCRKQRNSKFILASTSSIYGSGVSLPTKEDADSSRPLQPYAATKKAAEVLCHSYHHLHDVDVTIFRFFTVYGPAGRPDMSIFRFIQWIFEGRPLTVFGDGNQSRGFTFVDDIARGVILGLKPVGYDLFNLGGHEVVVINDLIAQIEAIAGKTAQIEHRPRHPADMLSSWADVDKARRILGWTPQVAFRDGLAEAIEWYQCEREWASQVNTEV